MLGVFVRALRVHGKPDTLYLDNGSTYRGELLRTACSRLGISLLHTRPYDPQAKGKMERFWRRFREQCLDHLGDVRSLDDVNDRLRVYLARFYLNTPHAGLLGRTPASAYGVTERIPTRVAADELRTALTVREPRRIRRDTTFLLDGVTYELEQGYLAGRTLTVGHCWLDEPRKPWVEVDGRTFFAHPTDAVANAHRPRPPRREGAPPAAAPPAFDPSAALTTTTEVDDDRLF
jgi:hypothetical protein